MVPMFVRVDFRVSAMQSMDKHEGRMVGLANAIGPVVDPTGVA